MNVDATARALRTASPTTRAKLRAVLEDYATVVDSRIAAMKSLSTSEKELRDQLSFSRPSASHQSIDAMMDAHAAKKSSPLDKSSDLHDTFHRLSGDVSRVFRQARVQRMRALAREKDDKRSMDFDGLEIQSMMSGSHDDATSSLGGPASGGAFRYKDVAEMGVAALHQCAENETRQNEQLRDNLQRLQKDCFRASRNACWTASLHWTRRPKGSGPASSASRRDQSAPFN